MCVNGLDDAPYVQGDRGDKTSSDDGGLKSVNDEVAHGVFSDGAGPVGPAG